MLLLDQIDLIARKKQRDVFYVKFLMKDGDVNDWEKPTVRFHVIEWLNKNGIKWAPCAPFSDGIMQYQGDIYVDLQHDPMNENFQNFLGYMENEDGISRIQGCSLHLLPLKVAMKNAYQDEPGFWENY